VLLRLPLVTAWGAAEQLPNTARSGPPKAEPQVRLLELQTEAKEVPQAHSTLLPARRSARPVARRILKRFTPKGLGQRPWPRKAARVAFNRAVVAGPAQGPVEHQAHSRPGSGAVMGRGSGGDTREVPPLARHQEGAKGDHTWRDCPGTLRRPWPMARLSPLHRPEAWPGPLPLRRCRHTSSCRFGPQPPSPASRSNP